ncbi:DUF917 family protein [Alkalihalobacillus xiaoxiensis]|uniref:DUF917 family protein n=1 Tax=Shouchella xiaoxiensis TaxID=766895 RepID=A0ABS2SNN7_9BACI|nr:DUF917 family protein [Shouchella xiaoxiensis]MBM7837130.1 DUF917 family protein [Shouchella xiaoxiensis]
MGRTWLSEEQVEQAVYGGAILGGGGGGWIKQGLENGKKALTKGRVELITVDELKNADKAVCVSLVGAPAAKEQYVSDAQFFDTIQLMQSNYPENIGAIMTNENGAATTVNGWLQAALSGLPVLDAPCNGRAHPTGSMGSLNLSDIPNYVSYQTAAGGKDQRAVRAFMSGELQTVGDAVRTMSVAAGGMVAVARNPVSIEYVKQNAAVGGITQAIELGRTFLSEAVGLNKIEAVTTFLQGRIVKVGTVNAFQLHTAGGFDVGTLRVDNCELTFWNEFMTIEENGERKGTFPDLIMTFDVQSGAPVVSAEIQNGQQLAVVCVPKTELLLSSTMENLALLSTIEPVIQKKIV